MIVVLEREAQEDEACPLDWCAEDDDPEACFWFENSVMAASVDVGECVVEEVASSEAEEDGD